MFRYILIIIALIGYGACVPVKTDFQTCLSRLDLAFAVDASYSVGSFYFKSALDLVEQVALQLNVSEDGVRISLLQFSDDVHVEFYLDEMNSEDNMSKMMDAAVYRQGNTQTGAALKCLREEVFTSEHGDRPEVPNLAIVLTDGTADDHDMLVTESRRLNQSGIVVFAVSVGYLTDPQELSVMGGNHVFHARSFMDLTSLIEYILQDACSVFGSNITFSMETATQLPMVSTSTDTLVTGSENGKATYDDLLTTTADITATIISSTASVDSDMEGTSSFSPSPKLVTSRAPCHIKSADVILLIDGSNSVGPDHFHRMKLFMASLVDTLDVRPDHVRLGVMVFSDDAEEVIKLGEFDDEDELKRAILDIRYKGGGTNTAAALQFLASKAFVTPRQHVPQVGLIMTAELSRQTLLTRLQANALQQKGVHMFVIGVGSNISRDELEIIASQPSDQYVLTVDDFDALSRIESHFAVSVCSAFSNTSDFLNDTSSSEQANTTGSDIDAPEGCQDVRAHCASYGQDMCSDYELWAKTYCTRTCGFCNAEDTTNISTPCEDSLSNCESYGTYFCHDLTYFEWARENCAKHCGLCGDSSLPSSSSSSGDKLVTTPFLATEESATSSTTTPEDSCSDTIPNCDNYGGPSVCQDYHSWASVRCRAYCGFCTQYVITDVIVVNGTKCPQWKLPTACTLDYSDGSCCPLPKCPDGYILTASRDV